ncbi:MAG: 5'-nucleotidase C-terminal domain-containing protein [Oscillibacter sp.]|nr:5'-nucleotidase C-terminal domain-containing protein [Oscillibacter sp.]
MTTGSVARRLATLALIIGVIWLWGVRALAASVDSDTKAVVKEAPDGDYSGKTVILHSNDVMGAVEGYPRMAWLKQEFERLGAETILVDAGNFSTSAIYTASKGADAVELMNLTGYDVAGMGRFDFSYGYDAVQRNMRRAAFPILCANALENEEVICTPNYSHTTKSGLTVGFFGLITPKAEANMNLMSTRNVKILERWHIYKCVQAQIDTLRQSGSVVPGADVVIALSSIGTQNESNAAGYSSLNIFSKARGLDMILDVMTENAMTSGPQGELVQACGEAFAHIGVIVIDNATKSVTDHYLIAADTLESDETVSQAVERLQNRYQEGYNAILARTETDLNGDHCTRETNLGNLIADAMVWTARQNFQTPFTDEAHMIGLTNGAAIRAEILEGYITRNHIAAVYPYNDQVCVVRLTGAELLEALEAATWCLPEKDNSYPQTSGISFTIDERIPFEAEELYPNSRYYRPAAVRRVHIDSVRGQPFNPKALYAVVTNSYCASGFGTFYLLGAAKERYDSTITMEQSITDYIHLGLGGVVTEAAYGKPKGEHTILS